MEILQSKREGINGRVLKQLIAYAEFQFGDRVISKSYRERGNGDRLSNWEVEIGGLYQIYGQLVGVTQLDHTLSLLMQNNIVIPYLKKMLTLLMPWL
jgi:hypothetical protein